MTHPERLASQANYSAVLLIFIFLGTSRGGGGGRRTDLQSAVIINTTINSCFGIFFPQDQNLFHSCARLVFSLLIPFFTASITTTTTTTIVVIMNGGRQETQKQLSVKGVCR